MSEIGTFWTNVIEKFFGLLLSIIGALLVYYTYTSSAVLGVFTSLFGFLSVLFLLVGLFLVTVKAE